MVSDWAGSQKSFSTFQLRSESDFIPKREVPEAESGSSMESSSGLLLLGDEFMTLSTFAQKALHGQEELEELRESFIGRMRQEKVPCMRCICSLCFFLAH